MRSRTYIAVVALLAATGTAALAESPAEFLKAVNTNHDRTLSLPEIQAYALKRFAALDTHKDGTLSKVELGDRISDDDFKIADTKHDARPLTLSKAEFSIYVSKLFAEANKNVKPGHTDVDGTLSAAELATPAGKKLIKLLE